MKRVAILISGGGSNMVRLCDSMTGDHPARPVLVVSNVPGASGLEKAATMGIPTACVDHRPYRGDREAFEADLIRHLDDAKPDIICLAGFMRIMTESFVSRYEDRMLNIHPSLLPKYPGLHTHRKAIEAGDTHAGCSVHIVTPVLDGGPVLGVAHVPIVAEETPESLAAKVLVQEHRLYPAVLRRFVTGDRSTLHLN